MTSQSFTAAGWLAFALAATAVAASAAADVGGTAPGVRKHRVSEAIVGPAGAPSVAPDATSAGSDTAAVKPDTNPHGDVATADPRRALDAALHKPAAATKSRAGKGARAKHGAAAGNNGTTSAP